MSKKNSDKRKQTNVARAASRLAIVKFLKGLEAVQALASKTVSKHALATTESKDADKRDKAARKREKASRRRNRRK